MGRGSLLLLVVLSLTLSDGRRRRPVAHGQHAGAGDALEEELKDLDVPAGLGEVAAPGVEAVALE